MANHHNDESTDNTTMIPMFGDLDPPDEDAFSQTTARSAVTNAWQLRILAYKWKTLKFTEFAKIDWEKKIDFQKFLAYCSEPEVCFLRKYRGKMVPIPCPKHREGTNLMWRMRRLAAKKAEEEGFLEWFWEKDRAEQEEKAKTDLWRLDKVWLPLGPGVAVIRGDMLIDVATFFRDCYITVELHNEPAGDRRLKRKGAYIVAHPESSAIRPFTRAFQVRVSIDKFNLPPTEMDLEHPGRGALRGLNCAHRNAMCGLIIFLGSTGEPASDNIDKECTYWFYCDWGFSGPDISKIGETPFRMVRLSNLPGPEVNELMNRLDLRPGKKRAQSFGDHFNKIVKPWRVTPSPWEKFHNWGDLRDVYSDSNEEDDFGEDDSSEDDPNEDDPNEDDSSEDDSSDHENPQQANTQEENNEPRCGPSIAARTRGACRRIQTANKRRLADEEPQANPRKKARIMTPLQRIAIANWRRRERGLNEDQDQLIQAHLQDEMIQAELRDDIYSAPDQEERTETQASPGLVSRSGQEAEAHEIITIPSDSEEEVEPNIESCISVAGMKSAIPKHLRDGAKTRWGAP